MKTPTLSAFIAVTIICLISGCSNQTNEDITNVQLLNQTDYQSLKTIENLESLVEDKEKPKNNTKKMTRKEFKKYWAILLTDLHNKKEESSIHVKKVKSELNDTTTAYKNLQKLYDNLYKGYNNYIDFVCNYMEQGFKERKFITACEDTLKEAEIKYLEFLMSYNQIFKNPEEVSFMTLTSVSLIESDSLNKAAIIPNPEIVKIILEVVLKVTDYIIDKANEINNEKKVKLIAQIQERKWTSWELIK